MAFSSVYPKKMEGIVLLSETGSTCWEVISYHDSAVVEISSHPMQSFHDFSRVTPALLN
jgi:hypothetical protein